MVGPVRFDRKRVYVYRSDYSESSLRQARGQTAAAAEEVNRGRLRVLRSLYRRFASPATCCRCVFHFPRRTDRGCAISGIFGDRGDVFKFFRATVSQQRTIGTFPSCLRACRCCSFLPRTSLASVRPPVARRVAWPKPFLWWRVAWPKPFRWCQGQPRQTRLRRFAAGRGTARRGFGDATSQVCLTYPLNGLRMEPAERKGYSYTLTGNPPGVVTVDGCEQLLSSLARDPSTTRGKGKAAVTACQQHIMSLGRLKLPCCRHEGRYWPAVRRDRAGSSAQGGHPVVQRRVSQNRRVIIAGTRAGGRIEPVEDGQIGFQHGLAVADPVILDVGQRPRRDLRDGVTLERQGKRWVLGERSPTEWAPPAGQQPFNGVNIPALDDEEPPLPKRVPSEEQRWLRILQHRPHVQLD